LLSTARTWLSTGAPKGPSASQNHFHTTKSAIRRPADIARRSAKALAGRDAFRRETFVLSREAAREMFRQFPKAAYMTEIESWCVLPGDRIEFTVRRLPIAD